MTVTPSVLMRLRQAGFKLTVARISVLQVIEAQGGKNEEGGESISAEDVHRQMLLRGTRASIGTVYRNIHQLEDAGFLQRQWDAQRRALYRIKAQGEEARLQLVCSESGRSFPLADADLHARLLAAAKREGLELGGQAIAVHVDCAGCADAGCPSRQRSRQAHAYDGARRLIHLGERHAPTASMRASAP